MDSENLKTGIEILDDYFEELSKNTEIDPDLRSIFLDLWKQKRLFTKTYLVRALDELREKKAK